MPPDAPHRPPRHGWFLPVHPRARCAAVLAGGVVMVRRILTAITLSSCFGLMLGLIRRAWVTEALSLLLVFIGCAAYLAWEMIRLIASTPKRRESPKPHPFDQQDTH